MLKVALSQYTPAGLSRFVDADLSPAMPRTARERLITLIGDPTSQSTRPQEYDNNNNNNNNNEHICIAQNKNPQMR